MDRIIAVECWADYYFFCKLLQNDRVVRKEHNKTRVIDYLCKNLDSFSVGIIDKDNDSIENFLSKRKNCNLSIEYKIQYGNELELVKINNSNKFIIQLVPLDFEKWITLFIENDTTKNLNEFGYGSQKELDKDCKVILEKILVNEKLKAFFSFVLTESMNTDNHILRIRRILEYLLIKKYRIDKNELENV